LEVELDDAMKADALEHLATELRHRRLVGDLDAGAESERPGHGPDLPARVLGDDLAVRPDLGVIAEDALFAALDGFLDDEIRLVRGERWREVLQHAPRVGADDVLAAADELPVQAGAEPVRAGRGLDDAGKPVPVAERIAGPGGGDDRPGQRQW